MDIVDTPVAPAADGAGAMEGEGEENALAVLANAANAAIPLVQATHTIDTIERNGGQVLQNSPS